MRKHRNTSLFSERKIFCPKGATFQNPRLPQRGYLGMSNSSRPTSTRLRKHDDLLRNPRWGCEKSLISLPKVAALRQPWASMRDVVGVLPRFFGFLENPSGWIVCIIYFGLTLLISEQKAACQPPNYKSLTLDVPKERSGLFWAKFNDDPLTDLLVSDDSNFYIYYQEPSGRFSAKSMQVIPMDSGALYDLVDLNHDGMTELVVLNESGVVVFSYDPAAKKMVKNPKPLLEGLRGIKVQHLAPADFVMDINKDGQPDIVYPMDGRYYLFFQDHGVFTKKNQITTKPIRIRASMGRDELRGEIENSITIPRPAFVDLNGDGRLDLRATTGNRESFYLQSPDGVIPENPTYEVDLGRFKEQVPKETGTVKVDQFQFIPADLDGDGREDYVIVAGNKIWVFKATAQGVDFSKPDQILKVSADHMGVVLLPLNDDKRPDLVVVKYQLPSLGRIVAGLAIGLRFEVEFLGYNNVQETVFSRKPDYRSIMVFKVPPLLKLLGELEDLQRQIRDLQRRTKTVAGGDFNGDGKKDVVKLEKSTLDVYFSVEGGAKLKTEFEEEQGDAKFFRDTLFGEKHRDVTLDTLLSFFSDTVNAFQEAAVAGRKPSFQIPVGDETAKRCQQIVCKDLNGDKMDDVVLFLAPPEGKENEDIETQTLQLWISESKSAVKN